MRLTPTEMVKIGGAWMALASVIWSVGGAVIWAASYLPPVREYAAKVSGVDLVIPRLDAIDRKIEEMNAERRASGEPCIRFPEGGHSVTDGEIGGLIYMVWGYFKLRSCGLPEVSVRLKNGGGFEHFITTTITDGRGRGIEVPPDPYQLRVVRYPGRIPSGDGVKPGRGDVRVCISYPDFPAVATECSPDVRMEIRPAQPAED